MTIQRKYTFQYGSKISSTQMNEELDQLVNNANEQETDIDSRFSKTGDTIKGDVVFDVTEAERAIKAIFGTDYHHGLYINQNGLGLFDWKSGRNIVSYDRLSDRVDINQQVWANAVLQNGWVNAGLGDEEVKFSKDANGYVHIKGTLWGASANIADGTNLFHLPDGFKPTNRIRACSINSDTGTNYKPCIITIETDGTVKCYGVTMTARLELLIPPFSV